MTDAPSDRVRILVVDDDEVDRMAVRRLLTAARVDAEVSEAASADDALAALRGRSFDCVFLDFRMPGVSGIELVDRVIAAAPLSPVIVVTGLAEESVAVEVMRAGAADYVTKDRLDAERLEQGLRWALGSRRLRELAHRAEMERRRWARMLSALTGAGVRVHASLELGNIVCSASEQIRGIFDAHVAVVVAVASTGAARAAIDGGHGIRELDAGDLEEPWGSLLAELRRNPRLVRLDPAALGDGTELAEVLAAPLFTRAGEPLGLIAVGGTRPGAFTEVDDVVLVQAAQTVSLAVHNSMLFLETRRASQARDEVLAIVSHDLRSPLTSVKLGASLLRDVVPRSEEVQGILTRIARGVDHMERLIADLLEAARIDAGALSVEQHDEQVAALVEEAMLFGEPLAVAAGVSLVALTAPVGVVSVDRTRLVQVFTNLVGNAIKFTPRNGRVEVVVAEEANELRITVADTGPGVPDANIPLLFERYYQSKSSPRHGIGLGLYIARAIVEAHGGRIWMENRVPAGAAVTFVLPRAG